MKAGVRGISLGEGAWETQKWRGAKALVQGLARSVCAETLRHSFPSQGQEGFPQVQRTQVRVRYMAFHLFGA